MSNCSRTSSNTDTVTEFTDTEQGWIPATKYYYRIRALTANDTERALGQLTMSERRAEAQPPQPPVMAMFRVHRWIRT